MNRTVQDPELSERKAFYMSYEEFCVVLAALVEEIRQGRDRLALMSIVPEAFVNLEEHKQALVRRVHVADQLLGRWNNGGEQ